MSRTASLEWWPIDAAAKNNGSMLVKRSQTMALVRWNGSAWVYPVTRNCPIDFEPEVYYDPSWRSAGAVARG